MERTAIFFQRVQHKLAKATKGFQDLFDRVGSAFLKKIFEHVQKCKGSYRTLHRHSIN
jgi:hypothetical protein